MKTKTPVTEMWVKSRALLPAFAAALIAFCPVQSRADTIALSFTGGTTTPLGNFTVGWAFTVSNPLLLTQLGIWDFGGDGLADPFTVIVWDSTGTPVVQTVVPSGMAGTLDQGFRYAPAAPTLLSAGTTYTIGAFYSSTSADQITFGAATVATDPQVTYIDGRSVRGNAFPPTNGFGFPNSYFGPNFQFTIPTNGGSVPDSGSTIFLM